MIYLDGSNSDCSMQCEEDEQFVNANKSHEDEDIEDPRPSQLLQDYKLLGGLNALEKIKNLDTKFYASPEATVNASSGNTSP